MQLLAVSSFKGDKQVDLIDFVPNATMHEISNMNERIEEETGNSERLLTKTDPGHPLMLLGADADDAYLQSVGRAIDAALEFWQRVVGMYEGKLLPGWERFASGHIENWYVLVLKGGSTNIRIPPHSQSHSHSHSHSQSHSHVHAYV